MGSGAGDQCQGRERKRLQHKGTDQNTGGQEHSLVVAHLEVDRYMKRVEFTPGASQPGDIVRGGSCKSIAKPHLETSVGICMYWTSSLWGAVLPPPLPWRAVCKQLYVPIQGSSTCLTGPCLGEQGATDSVKTRKAFLETPYVSSAESPWSRLGLQQGQLTSHAWHAGSTEVIWMWSWRRIIANHQVNGGLGRNNAI